jgi:hypothetical protein
MMLLSYSHKFIFIHVYKIAGTSIKKSLEKYAKRPVMRSFLNAIRLGSKVPYYRWRTFPLHIRAEDLKKEIPDKIYSNFYKFAFVRNPWEWQVSLYHHMLQRKEHYQHKLIKSMKNFDEYIEWRVNEDRHLQKDFITGLDGRVLVDFIGKYENLAEDFRHVCQNLHVTASLPHLNKSAHRNYESYYNAGTRKLVEENFREDIELFGYEF